MTLAQAKAQLRGIGVTINRTSHGEYRVNYSGGTEATAVYETDIPSAVATGIAMVRSRSNPVYKKYGGRQGTAEFRPMTLEEGKMLGYGDHIWFIGNDGSARQIKVNGAVKRWKREPDRIEVPVKYGMYEYATFYTRDFGPDGRVLMPV